MLMEKFLGGKSCQNMKKRIVGRESMWEGYTLHSIMGCTLKKKTQQIKPIECWM